MGVLVASFAGTTLDTAVRLQRYVVQELAATALPARPAKACIHCNYDLRGNVSGTCPECDWEIDWDEATNHSAPPLAGGGRMRSTSAAAKSPLNALTVLTHKHAATLFALIVGGLIAAMPAPSADAWTWASAGSGGLILWPLFGATNQLLGGLAFLVIGFYLWRRSKPVWFVVPPLIFMLIMPAWALAWQMFIEAPGSNTGWWQDGRWLVFTIGLATLALEVWMIVESTLLWPKVKGVMEGQLPGTEADLIARPAPQREPVAVEGA
jgi:carbon starvation protein